jgi:hypothetical protein
MIKDGKEKDDINEFIQDNKIELNKKYNTSTRSTRSNFFSEFLRS